MYVFITASVGTDTGPFDLYSDVDGYISAFASGVTVLELVGGYFAVVPDGTTNVKIFSRGTCTTSVIIPVVGITTTTTSTSTTIPPTTLPLMWPVIGSCCGLSNVEYLPFDGSTVFQVGDILAAYVIADNYFGGWVVQGAPVPGIATLYPFDNNVYGTDPPDTGCTAFHNLFINTCQII